MARDLPDFVKKAKDKGILDEYRFFRLVSEKANYMSEETIRTIYMSIVNVVGSEIKAHGVVRMPHIGDLALVEQPPRMGLIGRIRTMLPGTRVLKYFPNELFRRHMNEWVRVKAVEKDPML